MIRHAKDTLLYFVGIGGIGMSGIAEVFLNQGYPVSGSDLSESDITRRLSSLGAKIYLGHRAENINGARVVVISSAVKATNPEVVEARRLQIPVIPRAEMLGELMRGKIGLAIAGSHGKTTTTSLLATILTEAGLDPTLVIGGKVDSLGGNARLGQGRFLVAEADESDGSFLHLPTTFAAITNIDNDHLDFFGSLENIENAFIDFVGKTPFYGLTAVCGEDPGIQRCLPRFTKPIKTYGFSDRFDVYADQINTSSRGSSFQVYGRKSVLEKHDLWGQIDLKSPGRHNVLNSLAAILLAHQLDIPFGRIALGIEHFQGVRRRFEIRWQDQASKRAIVDDYAHHPTEVIATLKAAREFWPGRIITVFQPHRYSRTLHCFDEFKCAFSGTDVLFLTDIYAAGEAPIKNVSIEALTLAIAQERGALETAYSGSLADTLLTLKINFKSGDLILCMGAGSITQLAGQISSA